CHYAHPRCARPSATAPGRMPSAPPTNRAASGRRSETKEQTVRKKVTVVGAGNVGATCAQELARRDYANIVLVDIKPNFPQGKALDINQAGSVLGYEPNVVG